ncbi:hypothetical protein CBW65_11210 [Tumebacillus avium]|uniref:Uncharacterized protein n=1 Tax=Tumebacillus avium TaxID=1903704 RepID=A0A1Y0ILW2_9BACL|nr:hypothetical protein [Tumebacillus avium]ARU61512.1 hypothetical protein CBW65_11210 [Tumebacillus avium]
MVIFLLVITLVLLQNNDTNTSSTSEIKIVKKYEEDAECWIVGVNPQGDPLKQIKIKVEEREVWKLLQLNHVYAMTYFQEGDRDPVFVETVEESR